MECVDEVLVISDSGNHTNNCIIYDLKSGSTVGTFKEGRSVPKGLSFIGEDFLISALKDKPGLNVWTLSKTNVEKSQMICPGKVTCLAVSHCGNYCAAGIERFIYLWEVSSGNLLRVLPAHSQPASCLKFTSDGSFLISGGEDGLVLVWMLSSVVDVTNDCERTHYIWMDHSSEITDIFVGKLGYYGRVATASRDMSCKIYELDTGHLLNTVCTDYEITAVTMDNSEYFLFLGSADGGVYRINLFPVRDGEAYHQSADSSSSYDGHTGGITALSVSALGTYLLSGSEDGSCRLWDIAALTCIRKIPCDGAVTNAFITLLPPGLKEGKNYHPLLRISIFSRQNDYNTDSFIVQKIQNKKLSLTHLETPDQYFNVPALERLLDLKNQDSQTRVSVQELSTINQQLYSYALCDLVAHRSKASVDSE